MHLRTALAVAVAAAVIAAPMSAQAAPATFAGKRIVASAAGGTGSLLRPDPTLRRSSPGRRGPSALRLSNERTSTVWATPAAGRRDRVRARPLAGSRAVTRLHRYTEDGFPEVYLVLGARRDADGTWWMHLRLPRRPNGTSGWVPRRALGPLHVVHTLLVVDRRTMHVAFWSNGRKVWRARVGTGKPSTPTPGGHFWVRESFAVTGDPTYGPYAFGTSDYSVLTDWPGGGVIGIHGTDQPYLIPGHPSHGCMRLHNADVAWLSRHMPIGTPIHVV